MTATDRLFTRGRLFSSLTNQTKGYTLSRLSQVGYSLHATFVLEVKVLHIMLKFSTFKTFHCYTGVYAPKALLRIIFCSFLRLFCRMRNRLVSRSVDASLLLFVFSLTNAQLTKRKMSSNGSANVKHSEIIIR